MALNFDREVKLYMVFDILGDTERTGPLLWNIDRSRTEDVKNHIFDLMLMIRLLRKHLPVTLDYNLIDDYIICHDLPEAITGDITKFEGVSDEEVKLVTDKSINYLVQLFEGIFDFSRLFNGYENRIDIESKVVHMLDKIQSAIPFMKYQLENKINLNNPKISEGLRNHPFVVNKIAEGKDLADIFYEYHIRAINISDEERQKYGVSREDADLIVMVIKSYALSIYSKKQDGTLLEGKQQFPIEATKYNREM